MTLNPALKGFRRVAVCALETMLGHFCDAVVTVSENEYRCAVESGIDPRKLTVISNGVSQPNTSYSRSRDAIHRSLGLPPGVTCIGSIGRLVPQKQMGRLIDAFAVLKRRIQRSVCLVIVGWGHLEAELRHKVAALGLTDCVRFLGEADGPAHIPAFDVLALTSGYESFGYVFLEALAAGVPVVTTRVGAADDLVEEGVTGYIADPWDASVFASYLQLLAENDVIRSSMAAAARQRAAQFSADRMVDATLDLYNRILQRARASSAPALRRILPRNLP
jgi:glycosyltransferase involved in cell wall biosynthesis